MGKIAVISLGSRDFYQISLSFINSNIAQVYITDFYTPDVLRKYIKKRYTENLMSKHTVSLWPILLVFIPISKFVSNRFYDWIFGFLAGLYACTFCEEVIVYSYYATGFRSAHKVMRSKIEYNIFQVHPVSSQVKSITRKYPWQYAFTPEMDREMLFSKRMHNKERENLMFARNIIVASEFTKRGVIALGVDAKLVHVAPYGINNSPRQVGLDLDESRDGPVKLLWVGQLVYRKGFHILDAALDRMTSEQKFELTIVARSGDKNLINNASDKYKFLKGLEKESLAKEFVNADIFVLPSLIEGYGLVYLEAIGSGTPFICTENTGGADLLSTNDVGYICEAGNVDDLHSLLVTIYHNRENILKKKMNCIKLRDELGWNDFEKTILRVFEPNS